jgi:uncharacterized protein (DUF302 family)
MAGMTYPTSEKTVEHGASRISLTVRVPFDELRARFEAEVPAADSAELDAVAEGRMPWDVFVRGVAWEAPNGFVRLSTDDIGRVLAVAGREAPAVSYLVIDWAAAGRIHRLDPTALLYLPLRVLLASEGDAVVLTFEQPSAQLSSFGVNKLTQAGGELDRRLGDLIEALDIERPRILRR